MRIGVLFLGIAQIILSFLWFFSVAYQVGWKTVPPEDFDDFNFCLGIGVMHLIGGIGLLFHQRWGVWLSFVAPIVLLFFPLSRSMAVGLLIIHGLMWWLYKSAHGMIQHKHSLSAYLDG